MELTEENIKEIANLNSGQYVLLRNSKTVTVVPVCYLAGEIIKLKKRIAELEASYAERMRQYDHQQERACNAERRLEIYKLAAKTMLAHIWSWER